MINAKKEVITELSEMIHDLLVRKMKQAGAVVREDILMESRLYEVLFANPSLDPSSCAMQLEDRYGYDITAAEVVNIFRQRKMANPKERRELFEGAMFIVDAFEGAISGDKEAFKRYEKLRKEDIGGRKRNSSQEKLCVLLMYRRFPEIFLPEDMAMLEKLGNTLAKYLFYDISDAIREVFGFPTYKETKSGEPKKPKSKLTYEQAIRRINSLETELERTSSMLLDLQSEFDEQLSDSKIKEMTDFFAKLNSEKYGCILDQLLELRKGVDELRKSGYEVPIELNGLLIVVKKLIQFVRDSHIDPILKPNAVREVKAADVEFCDYVGTPFASEDEVKSVRTLSPGWIFRDKEIQISRPRVKEE